MSLEIEHKYLVKNEDFRNLVAESLNISQGYLCRDPHHTVRVRIKGDKGYLTVKGINDGAVRLEFEYEIDIEDAKKMLEMCEPPILEKTRHLVPFKGHIWEVDEFFGSHKGLITAEIELSSPDEFFQIPDFIGEDVTGNARYYNSNL